MGGKVDGRQVGKSESRMGRKGGMADGLRLKTGEEGLVSLRNPNRTTIRATQPSHVLFRLFKTLPLPYDDTGFVTVTVTVHQMRASLP
jgi:hypothetical protein